MAADPLTKDGGALRTLTTPALVAVLADAGHLAPLEQPEAFCALLLDFVVVMESGTEQ